MPIDPVVLILIALSVLFIALLIGSSIRKKNGLKRTLDNAVQPHIGTEEESLIYQSGNFEKTEEDVQFERMFHEQFRAFTEEAHYTKIAGCKHRNDDGTSRSAAIRKCQMFDELDMEHEPENPHDPNAIRIIHKQTGAQLGYVEARQASEIISAGKRGAKFFALFRRPTRHPETNRIVGGVYLLVRVKPGN